MARYIDADKLTDKLEELQFNAPTMIPVMKIYNVIELVEDQPTADVVEVVRCKDCKHSREFDKHCEINRFAHRHCAMDRGEEIKNVWHKYKKYYKDYSVVDYDGFCDYGERKDKE
jgi:hypothetical protein